MDSGPFSTPQPQDRRATTSRPPESVHRTVAQQPTEEPRPVRRAPATRHDDKSPRGGKRWLIPAIIAAVIVVLLAAGGWWFMSRSQGSLDGAINSSEYQAVFFTNGQVYFGKLHSYNSQYLKMTDIYYLQTKSSDSGDDSSNPQKTSTTQSDVQLIKLGDEIHGPQDEMIISRDQVLFYENLKPDGKVSQAIDKAKQ